MAKGSEEMIQKYLSLTLFVSPDVVFNPISEAS